VLHKRFGTPYILTALSGVATAVIALVTSFDELLNMVSGCCWCVPLVCSAGVSRWYVLLVCPAGMFCWCVPMCRDVVMSILVSFGCSPYVSIGAVSVIKRMWLWLLSK
jgi:hypothetical protein